MAKVVLGASDEFEETIRKNAVSYGITMFFPGVKTERSPFSYSVEGEAIENADAILDLFANVRAVMIYALDKDNHHALVGTIHKHNRVFKRVVPKAKR